MPRFARRHPIRIPIVVIALVLSVLATPNQARSGEREPLSGPHPWDFPNRNRDTSFAYQYARDQGTRGPTAGITALAAAYGAPVIINSMSTAVGNWQQIEMTLAEGAEGLIMTENHQDNSGNAQAVSDVLRQMTGAYSNGSGEQ